MNLWSPWLDPTHSLRGVDPERYVLTLGETHAYLSLGAEQASVTVAQPDEAYQFHTHERAVATARRLQTVLARPIDVVKLR